MFLLLKVNIKTGAGSVHDIFPHWNTKMKYLYHKVKSNLIDDNSQVTYIIIVFTLYTFNQYSLNKQCMSWCLYPQTMNLVSHDRFYLLMSITLYNAVVRNKNKMLTKLIHISSSIVRGFKERMC
jgi:hypothetical protein